MSRRWVVGALLFGLSAGVVAQRADVASAQNQKDKKDAALEKQLRAAQADLQQAEKQLLLLKQQAALLQAQNNKLEAALKKERGGDKADDKTIKGLRTALDGYRGAGLVHVVVLKRKADTPTTAVQALIDDVYGVLGKAKPVRGVWAGLPSAKGSPGAAATDYDVAVVVLLDNAAGLKQYLADPLHKKFADRHLSKWEAPTVYDFEPRKPAAP